MSNAAHTPRLIALKEVVDRIETIVRASYGGEINEARDLPDKYASAVRSVRFTGANYNYRADPAVVAVAEKIRASTEGAERRRGEIERDGRLTLLSSELESLRAVLPSLAAAAAIEIGCEARAAITKATGAAP